MWIDSDDDFSEELIAPIVTYVVENQEVELFRVNIPSDVFDIDEPDYHQRMGDQAIMEARERANTYRIPCEWQVLGWDGDNAIVSRTSRKADA